MRFLALDIGGANLKLADGLGYAESRRFEMWRDSHRLAQELRTFIAEAPSCDHIVATMTGELADCFETKDQGVGFIVRAVSEAADHRHTRIYLSNGTLVTPQLALGKPRLAAAANWHALARFAGRYARHGPAILVDIGSTTCDLIPLVDGQPSTKEVSDTDRLVSGELVYTGVERTPVCALVHEIPYRGQGCPVAREVFATAGDVYLLLGELREEAQSTQTADGRPATIDAARVRLGRMICADGEAFTHQDAAAACDAIRAAQLATIVSAARQIVRRLPGALTKVVLSGQGEFLARRAVEELGLRCEVVSLTKELGPEISRCAPAHGLAVLAREAAGVK
jgi:probable H4MPT-linked C1 transfer pathway protein